MTLRWNLRRFNSELGTFSDEKNEILVQESVKGVTEQVPGIRQCYDSVTFGYRDKDSPNIVTLPLNTKFK